MKNHVLTVSMLSLSTAIVASPVFGGDEEEHFDVWIQLSNGALSTGAIGEDGDPIHTSHRVFGAEFGEEPTEPFSADEPGFQTLNDPFAAFYEFRIDITSDVQAWNGGGFSPTDETITLEFGPQSVTSGAGLVNGFNFTADGDGGFHDHFEIILNGNGGNDPNGGIYLLPLQIADASGAFDSTETFWFVMNLDQIEEDHEAAIEWVEANLVPAPGALTMLALASLVGSRRRRRSENG